MRMLIQRLFSQIIINGKAITSDCQLLNNDAEQTDQDYTTDAGTARQFGKRVDAGFISKWRVHFNTPTVNSSKFVVLGEGSSQKLFVVNRKLDAGGNWIGNDPVIPIYDGDSWDTTEIPGPNGEPAESLVGLDVMKLPFELPKLYALILRHDDTDPHTVHFYESTWDAGAETWSSPALVGDITDHTSGPLPIGIDFQRCELGTDLYGRYILTQVSYGNNVRLDKFGDSMALPPYSGVPRELECAPYNNRVVMFYTTGGSQTQIWFRGQLQWDFEPEAATADLVGLGYRGSIDTNPSSQTGWAIWKNTGSGVGEIKYRFRGNSTNPQTQTFSSIPLVLTDYSGSSRATPQRIEVAGPERVSNGNAYVTLYSEGVYDVGATKSFGHRYHLLEGFRCNWESGVTPDIQREVLWHGTSDGLTGDSTFESSFISTSTHATLHSI
jgi:hypothetical protein